jgi:hypothetical protein
VARFSPVSTAIVPVPVPVGVDADALTLPLILVACARGQRTARSGDRALVDQQIGPQPVTLAKDTKELLQVKRHRLRTRVGQSRGAFKGSSHRRRNLPGYIR